MVNALEKVLLKIDSIHDTNKRKNILSQIDLGMKENVGNVDWKLIRITRNMVDAIETFH